jgi:tetratricopeptide (TPR) repeat protein
MAQNRNLQAVAVPNRFAQHFHLTRLMELQPKGKWQRMRGTVRHQLGDIQGSYDDFLAVYKNLVPDLEAAKGLISERLKSVINAPARTSEPKQVLNQITAPAADMPLLSALANCSMGLGKMDEYQHWCRQMERVYRSDHSIENLNAYAWIAGIGPCSGTDWQQIVQYFKQGGEKAKEANCVNTLALIEYRAGQYKNALKLCNEGIKNSLKINAPFDWIIAGMCHAKLSDLEGAGSMMAKIQEWSTNQNLLHAAKLKGFGTAEYNPIPTAILLKEFEKLLKEQHSE